MFSGSVTKMWRWPVKGLRGETVRSAEIGPHGMTGDRVLKVFKTGTDDDIWAGGHPRMLEWEAAWPAQCGCADGVGDAPVVYEPGGAAWAADDPGLGAAMADDLGEEALDLRKTDTGTSGRVLVVFEASLKRLSEEMGREIEPERFRPNVMIEADLDPYAEARFERGMPISLGGNAFVVHKPCERCVLPSWDPRGRERDKELHKHIVRGLGNHFGVYLKTPETVSIGVGDEVGG
ncbi:MOSC domain-containing protein [Glycomyces tenuis]|uniref:MOSC domain-containing protein n=1 Tax=Glycomyces tenuis TaxID=58116 RepID=UPI0012DCAB8E|nr:MOSC domain-containing protein [Glycomyces tenuis]